MAITKLFVIFVRNFFVSSIYWKLHELHKNGGGLYYVHVHACTFIMSHSHYYSPTERSTRNMKYVYNKLIRSSS